MDLSSSELSKHGLFNKIIKDNKTYVISKSCNDIILSLLADVPDNQTINIFIPTENHLAPGDFEQDVESQMLLRGIKINFIFGGFYKYSYTEKYDCPEKNRFLHLWPTSGIFDGVERIISRYSLHKLEKLSLTSLEYSFASLTYKARPHRCYLLDNLFRHDLLKNSLYSWHNHWDGDTGYEWKYTAPNDVMNILNDNFSKHINWYVLPSEYYKCFLHLVSEGLDDGMFITEKTVVPIMFRKPFLVQGIQGFHQHLMDLGFEMYDEIFDYDFDKIESWTKRTDGLISNIKRIDNENYNKLYQKIKDKVDYNHNRMIQIINKKVKVPDVVRFSSYMHKKYPMLQIGFGKISQRQYNKL